MSFKAANGRKIYNYNIMYSWEKFFIYVSFLLTEVSAKNIGSW